jgi:hypothetical protein
MFSMIPLGIGEIIGGLGCGMIIDKFGKISGVISTLISGVSAFIFLFVYLA